MGFRIPRGENNGGTWKPLPVGTYDFRITAAEPKTSSAGNPQLKVSMEVIGPTLAGKKATCWLSGTAAASWTVEALFGCLGIDKVDTGEVDDEGHPIDDYEEQDLVGRCVTYDVTIDSSYNPDKPQNRFGNPKVSEYDPYYEDLKAEAPAASQVPAQRSTGATTTPKPAAPGGEGAPPRLARRPRPAPQREG